MTTKIFTQKELEAAYKQMQNERKEDVARAERMLCWLCKEMEVERRNCNLIGGNDSISPYSYPYDFIFIHQTYGPYLEDFTKVLDKFSFVKKIKEDSFSKSPIYEATTPEGVYKIGFEYFDNHCTGY